jgi:hypothetical protein
MDGEAALARTIHEVATDQQFGARVKLTPPINSEGHDYGLR